MSQPAVCPKSLKPGYFLAQEAMSLPRSSPAHFLSDYCRPFATLDGVKRFFEQIAGKVDGLDYVNYWREPADGEMAAKIAEIGRGYGIDLWAGIRWRKQFRDVPNLPGEFVAWQMDSSGRILPAPWESRNYCMDYLNPQAVDWMMDVLEERYWPYVKGLVNGWFFPENRIECEVPYGRDGLKVHTVNAYSDYVLSRWREYAARNDIRVDGAVIDRFPVPAAHLTSIHPEKTVFVPDNRPTSIPAFTRLADIPHGTAVWCAWEDFLCELFHESFIHRVARRVNRYHADVPDWRGVCFFNNDVTALDYRNFNDRGARTGLHLGQWPQGRRMGVDLRRLLKDPEITCLITETINTVFEYARHPDHALSHGMAMAREYGRLNDYGFMIHYSDSWGGIMDDLEEDLRWKMFHQYRPPVFSFYSLPKILVREGEGYNPESADRFWRRLREYKESFR